MTDGQGQLVQFRLRPGNAAEGKELPGLLESVPWTEIEELLGDKAYDSNGIRRWLADRDIIATIPGKASRKEPIWFAPGHYQSRHLIENAFSPRKQFRGLACRYAKLADSFAGMVSLVAWFLGTKRKPGKASAEQRAPAAA